MNYIVDDIGTAIVPLQNGKWWAPEFDQFFRGQNIPQYLYGHEQEIANRLTVQGQNPDLKEVRYPLIALRLDTREFNVNGVIQFSLNLVIVHKTDKNYNAEQRYTNVFKPVLYPLYAAFMQSLADCGLFTWPQFNDVPEHSKFDRPFWGTPRNTPSGDTKRNIANIFNDPLDAIEIIGLKLNQKPKNC